MARGKQGRAKVTLDDTRTLVLPARLLCESAPFSKALNVSYGGHFAHA